MNSRNSLWGYVYSLVLITIFVIWVEFYPDSLQRNSDEDGLIENLSALFFFATSICFFLILRNSDYLREQGTYKPYFMTFCWALLMFIFAGEEISWGQRIFGIETP